MNSVFEYYSILPPLRWCSIKTVYIRVPIRNIVTVDQSSPSAMSMRNGQLCKGAYVKRHSASFQREPK
ncbi:hypothetical protein J6590_074858 [Homalodisca vitripennis]|nr:hypothetical protein J6590_074858 [Homalodisca vitripennis]